MSASAFSPGSFFEDQTLSLSGRVEKCHFYRCRITVEPGAFVTDCAFCDMPETDFILPDGFCEITECVFDWRSEQDFWDWKGETDAD